MSSIIFVGDSSEGYFAEEVAKVRGFEYKNVERKSAPQHQVNDILFASGGRADYIIFDVEQYISSAAETAEEIKRICDTINAKPIIYAPSFIPESEMARAFVDNDIRSFILAGSAADLKDQLEKNMNGFFDVNERKEITAIKEVKEKEESLQNFKTIGIAGACHRIGTTTQAVQIVKYLKLKGYKACLIEMNDNKYQDKKEGNRNEISFVEKIEAWFDVDKYDEEIGMVSAFGIDMYFRQNKIPEVLKKGYDYYIYDYGCYQDRAFNKTAFVREDIKLFVVGAAVTELDYTKDVAENLFYQDAKIIFSLTAKSEEEDLLSLMNSIKTAEGSSNAKRTYFAAYSPDPFALPEESLALYEAIIPVENISKETPRAKSLFGFSKKGDKKKNGKV